MFLDSHVLVYARFDGAPQSELACGKLCGPLNAPVAAAISRQVVREYLAVSTRPRNRAAPLSMAEALKGVTWLRSLFTVLEDGPAAMDELERLCRDVRLSGRQVHDANWAATMVAHGERQLLTFNPRELHRYGGRLELVEIN